MVESRCLGHFCMKFARSHCICVGVLLYSHNKDMHVRISSPVSDFDPATGKKESRVGPWATPTVTAHAC